jgi:hypothetical protein
VNSQIGRLALFPLLVGLAGIGAFPLQAAPLLSPSNIAATQSQGGSAAKVRQYLDQLGGSYTKVSETVWTVPYQGKSFKDYDVFISTIPNSDLIVFGVSIAAKKNLKPSQDFYLTLLRYNNAVDSVKVMIDDDGDLLLRADVNGRIMDFQEFKDILEQVAAATDELHSQIKSSLISQ